MFVFFILKMASFPCPLCLKFFPEENIQEHAEDCVDGDQHNAEPASVHTSPPAVVAIAPSDKLPSESFGDYYTRMGCQKLCQVPAPLPETPPSYLMGNPFVIICPYHSDCGWMEACSFPTHVKEKHTGDTQQLFCPVCELMVGGCILNGRSLDSLRSRAMR